MKNTQSTDGSTTAVLEVTNGAGKRYNGSNCPPGIRPAIEKAVKRGQTSGTVAGGGQLWRWHTLLPETITLQFTRDDVIVQEIQIPATGWAAFQIVAQERNVDPRRWLTVLLGNALADGVSLEEMVTWLFPSKVTPGLPAINRKETP
jgi:hypothetical protein